VPKIGKISLPREALDADQGMTVGQLYAKMNDNLLAIPKGKGHRQLPIAFVFKAYTAYKDMEEQSKLLEVRYIIYQVSLCWAKLQRRHSQSKVSYASIGSNAQNCHQKASQIRNPLSKPPLKRTLPELGDKRGASGSTAISRAPKRLSTRPSKSYLIFGGLFSNKLAGSRPYNVYSDTQAASSNTANRVLYYTDEA
jgi:hypothetical protein